MKKKMFLIDGNSFCYRAYFAIKNLSTSKGQPTNAIYGFLTMLNSLLEHEKPDYIAVAFDLKGPTFRHKKFKDYKIQRKPMPDNLTEQIPIIKEIIKNYNIPIFEKDGFEADDIIGTLVKRFANQTNIEIYIVTGDKDMLQLVNAQIKVYSPHKESLIYDEKKVKERFGVEPARIVEIMALMGDSSDNIPGVPGIGEKTAIELIKEFKTLDTLFSKFNEIKSERIKRILEEFRGQAEMSKELATCNVDVPIKVNLKDLKRNQPDKTRLFQIFKELEFRRLLKDISPQEILKVDYRYLKSTEEIERLLSELKRIEGFAFDLDMTDSRAMFAELKGASFSYREREVYYISVENRESKVESKLKLIFEDEKIKKFGYNIKFKKMVLAKCGIELKGISFDIMVASYLLSPSKLKDIDLNDISLQYLGYKIGADSGTALKEPFRVCCENVDAIFRLKRILEEELKEKSLENLFFNLEIPLIEVLADMEINGIAIDKKILFVMSKEMEEKLSKLIKRIYDTTGIEFNLNSPKQLKVILFKELKLPVIKKTKTGPSTDADVLRSLSSQHTLPAMLLEYRELFKLKSTYIDGLLGLVKTGRIHTSFNQTGTQTGRLSSSNPNLQNIPIKTEMGRGIRKAFIPNEENSYLLSADYSQIELRILAHLSNDENLIDAFEKGLDIHKYTASLIFGLSEENINEEMRNLAKTVNFGIIYGMSPYGLSQDLEIDGSKAKEFIDAYFCRYPKVKEYIDNQIEGARKSGYVMTLFGRKRYIPEINSQNNNLRQFAERVAINTPIQGSAADLIKVAMINIHRGLKEKKLCSRMILQVHDELLFDVPKDEVDMVKQLVKFEMEGVEKLKVPIRVDIKIGRNWLEMT